MLSYPRSVHDHRRRRSLHREVAGRQRRRSRRDGIPRGAPRIDGNETLAKNGISVIEPDAAMEATLNKVGEQMLGEWIKTAGGEGEALIKAYRTK